jgi:hypothetical protein
MREDRKVQEVQENKEQIANDSKPIEPKSITFSKLSAIKLVIFFIFIGYLLFSNFRVPILIRLGSFLVVEHIPQESDLIVCMAGRNIERGLTVLDVYNKGLAPKIFIAREEPPDGYILLEQGGIEYPETNDLFKMFMEKSGVPEAAILSSVETVDNTMDEALLLKRLVTERDIKSIIIITSPTHTRRAWLTFRKILKENDVRITMIPSGYSDFNPDDWWKKRKYKREVIIEYQKLIYYWLKLI